VRRSWFTGDRRFLSLEELAGENMRSFRRITLIRIDPERRMPRRSIIFLRIFNDFTLAAGAAAL
jgi:hypothetical protein